MERITVYEYSGYRSGEYPRKVEIMGKRMSVSHIHYRERRMTEPSNDVMDVFGIELEQGGKFEVACNGEDWFLLSEIK